MIVPTLYYLVGVGLPAKERAVFAHVKESLHPHHTLSSPPHITLLPPFTWQNEAELVARLSRWGRQQISFTVQFAKVGSFRQRDYGTVYLSPESGEELRHLASSLDHFLFKRTSIGEYVPHLTVAQRVPLDTLPAMKKRVRAMGLRLSLLVDRVVLYRRVERGTWADYRECLFSRV